MNVSLAVAEWHFRARCVNRGLFTSATLRRRRDYDGFMASVKQSGTHWVKYMLGLTLARIHGLPEPAHIQDDSIVGHPKAPPRYAGIPRIVNSHSMPHYLQRSALANQLLGLPPTLILVRDLRDALVAGYEKWKYDYHVDFSTYLRGDVNGKRYDTDIWEQLRFLNGWGAVAAGNPARTAILRYEDLRADTLGELARVCDFFGINGATPDLLALVIADATKERMAERPNPAIKRPAVRLDDRSAARWYNDADRHFVSALCRRHLRYDFGYDYR